MAHSPPKKDKSPQPTYTTKSTHSIRVLLIHAWLLLGRWLGRLLLLLLAVGLGGWAIDGPYYAQKFSGPAPTEKQIAPDETRITQTIIQDATHVVEQHCDNTRALRDAHAKVHGCVKAEFKVRVDLNPTLHHSVFAEASKSWNAWAHFSNGNIYPQSDSKNDVRGMAIKLFNVPSERLLLDRGHDGEQDFIVFSQPVSFICDITEYRQNFAAQADSKRALAFFPNWNPTSWELHHLPIALCTLIPILNSPLYAGYSGISPYKLGEHNVKSRVVPAPEKYPVYQLSK